MLRAITAGRVPLELVCEVRNFLAGYLLVLISTLRRSAGIPTIIKPFFGDQFFWADRVEALGVGSGVRKLTVDSLKEALIAATTDHKQIDRAKLLGEQIRAVRAGRRGRDR